MFEGKGGRAQRAGRPREGPSGDTGAPPGGGRRSSRPSRARLLTGNKAGVWSPFTRRRAVRQLRARAHVCQASTSPRRQLTRPGFLSMHSRSAACLSGAALGIFTSLKPLSSRMSMRIKYRRAISAVTGQGCLSNSSIVTGCVCAWSCARSVSERCPCSLRFFCCFTGSALAARPCAAPPPRVAGATVEDGGTGGSDMRMCVFVCV